MEHIGLPRMHTVIHRLTFNYLIIYLICVNHTLQLLKSIVYSLVWTLKDIFEYNLNSLFPGHGSLATCSPFPCLPAACLYTCCCPPAALPPACLPAYYITWIIKVVLLHCLYQRTSLQRLKRATSMHYWAVIIACTLYMTTIPVRRDSGGDDVGDRVTQC